MFSDKVTEYSDNISEEKIKFFFFWLFNQNLINKRFPSLVYNQSKQKNGKQVMPEEKVKY